MQHKHSNFASCSVLKNDRSELSLGLNVPANLRLLMES